MKLLILGGTRFLGRHLAEQALAAGHAVTLLHRGISQRNPRDLFPQADHRIGDRDGSLDVLATGTWDAVIDTSAYTPRQVRRVAEALAGRVGHYQLVSTVSVYAAFTPGVTEDAPRQVLSDPGVEQVTGETYGGLKALCEDAAFDAAPAFGGRVLVVRPGLLVGPWDPTGRFTWWVDRLQRGGPLLAPGDPATPVQFIDARDAAAWMLRQSEAGHGGPAATANLTGPLEPLTFGKFLQTAAQVLGGPDTALQWVDEAWLLQQGVSPWTDLPVWLPRAQAGLHQVNLLRAIDRGLVCRPLAQTLVDTARWRAEEPVAASPAGGPPRPPVGLVPEREAQLLRDARAAGVLAEATATRP